MKAKITLVVAASAALLLAACGDDDDDGSAADSAEDLCSDIAGLASTFASAAGADVDPNTTTIDDVQNALEDLAGQVEAVQNAEDELAESVRSDLADAYEEYVNSIADISGDETLAEAGATVESAQADFRQAWETTLSELDCTPPAT